LLFQSRKTWYLIEKIPIEVIDKHEDNVRNVGQVPDSIDAGFAIPYLLFD
jgi:hypothetical protein